MEQTSQQLGGLNAVQDKGGLSKADRMTPFQIIEHDIEKFNLGLDARHTYATVLEMIKKPEFRVVRANNTIMVIHNQGNGNGDAMMFTADKPQMFVKSLRHFNTGLKIAKYNKVTFTSSGIAIEPLMKKAGLQYKAIPVKVKSGDKIIDGKRITVFE
jgi:hypothetical protein